jgi:hypothetical protein
VTGRCALTLALAGGLLAAGCERAVPELPPPDRAPGGPLPAGNLPQALMVRFQEVKGAGFSRESWEVEILQLGGDVRIRGSLRTGGLSIPILSTMSPQEYADFWTWLRSFPLERGRPAEDPAASPAEWRKTFAVDVVLDEQTRWKSRTSWTRPLGTSSAWVGQIENRLHELALDLANREVARQEKEAAASPGTGAPATGVPPPASAQPPSTQSPPPGAVPGHDD